MKKTALLLVWSLLAAGFVRAALPSVPASAQGSYDVVIIVADDFSGLPLDTVDTGQFDSSDNCTVSLEGQAFAVRGASVDPIDETHGDLVYAQLDELLSDANAGGVIDLVQVDIQGVTTDVAADLISNAIADHPADFYVVNMSFVIIPCEYIAGFADFESQAMDARTAKDLNRFRGLFQRAVVFYDNTVFPSMSNRAQNETDLDPLQSLFTSLRGSVIPVAAAGNFGLDFPFWPGAWGQVISVSASEGTGYDAPVSWDKRHDTPLLGAEDLNPGRTTRISNYGEVMMPGEYDSDSGMVSGTSFAAPRLSVAMAVYVSEVGSSYCQQPDGDPALAYGDWDNLTLDQVINDYCSEMGSHLP
jgi:subtilisin family serine protease